VYQHYITRDLSLWFPPSMDGVRISLLSALFLTLSLYFSRLCCSSFSSLFHFSPLCYDVFFTLPCSSSSQPSSSRPADPFVIRLLEDPLSLLLLYLSLSCCILTKWLQTRNTRFLHFPKCKCKSVCIKSDEDKVSSTSLIFVYYARAR
jgi:hypothetical protein